MPNDPYDRGNWNPAVGAGHGANVVGLDHIACITADMDAVLHFFTALVDGAVTSDEHTQLPQPARRVVIRLGDADLAFLQPDDKSSGPLGAFLNKKQNGIYALVWKIPDEARAKAHFTGGLLKLRLTEEDCVSSGFAIDPEDFLGARHEFVMAV
jgi:catechol 2,3-dioxygenase-like lactoylglutathione lyase family enzyme